VSDDDRKQRLAQLEERIAKVRKAREPGPSHGEEHYSQAQLAWRMVIELVAGLGIGFGIGYGLDSLFGTIPIFLVLFTFLGLAAGVKTMMRSAAEVQARQEADVARTGTQDDTAAPAGRDDERT
jgi:ATP synthase protein I